MARVDARAGAPVAAPVRGVEEGGTAVSSPMMPLSMADRAVADGVDVIGSIGRDELTPNALEAAAEVADTAETPSKTRAMGEASIGTAAVASGNDVVIAGVGICVAVFVRVTALMSATSAAFLLRRRTVGRGRDVRALSRSDGS